MDGDGAAWRLLFFASAYLDKGFWDTTMASLSVPSLGPSVTDYADSLRLLKAQHIVLSAKRERLTLAAERQCDGAADLIARIDFLHQMLESFQSADVKPAIAASRRPPWFRPKTANGA